MSEQPIRAGARVLVFSSLFPSPAAPGAGLFIRERMFRVAARLPLAVVAPQAWSPFDALVRLARPGFRPPAPVFERMDGIEVHRPRFFSMPGVFKRLDGWLMARGSEPVVRRVAATLGATVIDAHFGYPDGAAAVRLGRRLGLPVVISLRGSKDQRLIGGSREAGLRAALAGAAQLIAVSASLVRDVGGPLGLPPERFMLVGNGVDTRRFAPVDRHEARARLGIAPDAPVLIGVGNRIPLKGFQRVIPIVARLRQRFPGLVYLIVGGAAGEADLGPELARQAHALGVAEAVRLCGAQSPEALCWHYGAADVFVHASEYEGWANVLLEAMACGLPVVCTDVGGNAEVLTDPSLGTLVPWWDEAAFEQALAQALRAPWDRQRIRTHALAHGWEARVEQLVALFERVSNAAGHAISAPPAATPA